jgi:hypothetical protein
MRDYLVFSPTLEKTENLKSAGRGGGMDLIDEQVKWTMHRVIAKGGSRSRFPGGHTFN